MTPNTQSNARHQAGGSLIEVMVSVLVLSAGLLGIGASQLAALKNSQSSYGRSQAVMLTSMVFDAMRANLQVARTGGYNHNATLASCTVPAASTTLASADLNHWVASVHQQLGSTSCARVACTNATCTVTLSWDDSRGAGGSSSQQLVTVSRL